MKDKIYLIFTLIFISIFLLLSDTCNKPNTQTLIKSDTVTITKSDTIFAKDTVYVYKRLPKVTDSIYIKDTLHICDYIRTYTDTVNDTNITIVSDNIVRGEIIGGGLSYKLKVPIKIVDSVFTTITNTVEKQEKYNLKTGVNLTVNSMTPFLQYEKNKVSLLAGYDLIHKTPSVGLAYKIYSK